MAGRKSEGQDIFVLGGWGVGGPLAPAGGKQQNQEMVAQFEAKHIEINV